VNSRPELAILVGKVDGTSFHQRASRVSIEAELRENENSPCVDDVARTHSPVVFRRAILTP
jgi:hypothetical protein